MVKEKFYLIVYLISFFCSIVFCTSSYEFDGELYKDTEGADVTYDHSARIKEIENYKAQGKELHMVIGRGAMEVKTAERPHRELRRKLFLDYNEALGDENNVWVYANDNPFTQEYGKYPHLLFDFNKKEDLDSIPDNTFKSIVFDNSTTKFLSDPIFTFNNLGKKLIVGGNLYILPGSYIHFPGKFRKLMKSKYSSEQDYLAFYQKFLGQTIWYAYDDEHLTKIAFQCTIESNNYPIAIKGDKKFAHLKCNKTK